MARFTLFGDSYVIDRGTYNQLPIDRCIVSRIAQTSRGVYNAIVQDGARPRAEVLFRMDTIWEEALEGDDASRERGIILYYLEEGYPDFSYLATHVLSVQVQFDPPIFIEPMPLLG